MTSRSSRGEGRASRRSPLIGPAFPYESSVPAEHGVWPYEQKRRARPREAGAERGEQSTVGVVQPWATDLPPEHMQLVAKNDNLDLLRGRGPERERDQLDQAAQRPVDEGDDHTNPFLAEAAKATRRHRCGSPTARPPTRKDRTLGAGRRRRVSAPLRVGVVALPELFSSVGLAVSVLVLVGGGLYTLGALAYVLRRPDPAPAVFGYHEVFHLLVIAAAVVQYIAVSFVVLGAA